MISLSRPLSVAVAVQVAAVLFSLCALRAIPPEEGPVLVLPLDGAREGVTLAWALTSGSRLIARGWLPGSLVIWGRGAELARVALSHNSLVLRARDAGCEASSKERP